MKMFYSEPNRMSIYITINNNFSHAFVLGSDEHWWAPSACNFVPKKIKTFTQLSIRIVLSVYKICLELQGMLFPHQFEYAAITVLLGINHIYTLIKRPLYIMHCLLTYEKRNTSVCPNSFIFNWSDNIPCNSSRAAR